MVVVAFRAFTAIAFSAFTVIGVVIFCLMYASRSSSGMGHSLAKWPCSPNTLRTASSEHFCWADIVAVEGRDSCGKEASRLLLVSSNRLLRI
jgi:hypothetical protein